MKYIAVLSDRTMIEIEDEAKCGDLIGDARITIILPMLETV